jgi:hypothetical protein
VAHEAFALSPFIALACGAVAGLGVLHSARRAFALALALVPVQVGGWIVILMTARAGELRSAGDWNVDLYASFLICLIVVVPYTVIGVVVSGSAIALLCHLVRRRGRINWSSSDSSGSGHHGGR